MSNSTYKTYTPEFHQLRADLRDAKNSREVVVIGRRITSLPVKERSRAWEDYDFHLRRTYPFNRHSADNYLGVGGMRNYGEAY